MARAADYLLKDRLGRLGTAVERALSEARLPIPADLAELKPQSVVDLSPGRRSGAFSTRWRVRD